MLVAAYAANSKCQPPVQPPPQITFVQATALDEPNFFRISAFFALMHLDSTDGHGDFEQRSTGECAMHRERKSSNGRATATTRTAQPASDGGFIGPACELKNYVAGLQNQLNNVIRTQASQFVLSVHIDADHNPARSLMLPTWP